MQQCGVGGVAVSDLSQHRPVLGRGGATVLTIVTGPAAAAAAAAPAAASGEAGPAAVSETAALWSGFTTVATVSGSPTAFIGMPSGLRGDGGRGGGGHGSVRLGVAREPCIWSAQPRPAGGPTPLYANTADFRNMDTAASGAHLSISVPVLGEPAATCIHRCAWCRCVDVCSEQRSISVQTR